MLRASLTLILVSAVTVAAGCGQDEDATDSDTANVSDSDDSRNRHEDQDCFYIDFAFETETAVRDSRLDALLYTATTGPSSDQDRMTLDFHFDRGATDGAQRFNFIDEDPTACHTCLLIQRGCTDEQCADGQSFLPVQGSMELIDVGAAGESFIGGISDTLLTEVTIDPGTQVATPLEGGETWCLIAHPFDLVVE